MSTAQVNKKHNQEWYKLIPKKTDNTPIPVLECKKCWRMYLPKLGCLFCKHEKAKLLSNTKKR